MHRIKTKNKDALIMAMRCMYAKDLCLYKHSMLTANIAREIVENIKMDFKLSETEAFEAGVLHDIGKITVADVILSKNTMLNKREIEIIKRHPVWGSDQIENTVFSKYCNIVLRHHENIFGTGYPLQYRLTDEDTDIKLIALSDQIAAYLENRPYRRTTYNKDILIHEIDPIVDKLSFEHDKAENIKDIIFSIAERWHNKTNIFSNYENIMIDKNNNKNDIKPLCIIKNRYIAINDCI